MAHAPHQRYAPGGRRRRHRVAPGLVVGAMLAGALVTAGQAAAAPVTSPGARSASAYGFSTPDAATLDGGVLFVANKGGNSVTEINAASGGHIVARITGSRYRFERADRTRHGGQGPLRRQSGRGTR